MKKNERTFRISFNKFFILISAMLVVLFNNCSRGQIRWGSSDNGSVIAGNPLTFSSLKILSAVCQNVMRCHPSVTASDCESGAIKAEGMALPLGLLPFGYTTLESMAQSESAGLLVGQLGLTATCSAQIASTDCATPAAQGAYDANSAQPYSAAKKLVADASCGGTFLPAGAADVCPSNYVSVPALNGYTTQNFCVSKYGMKDSASLPTAQAAGLPWVLISRDQAISSCRSLGTHFDLISNAEWQATALNIANQGVNWSSGIAYIGELNRGYSNNYSSGSSAASPDDNQACFGTGQVCSSSQWSDQRRTHVLSSGGVIWDLSGNVWQWVSDNYSQGPSANQYIIDLTGVLRTQFGNNQICQTPGAGACGFGYGQFGSPGGAIARGDTYAGGSGAGVFAVDLRDSPSYQNSIIGYRCVYHPPP